MDPARGRICFLKNFTRKKREDEKNSWHQDTFILEFIGLASGKKVERRPYIYKQLTTMVTALGKASNQIIFDNLVKINFRQVNSYIFDSFWSGTNLDKVVRIFYSIKCICTRYNSSIFNRLWHASTCNNRGIL